MTENLQYNKINLFGVSGAINSGKDTVGKIIRYLTCTADHKDSMWSREAYFGDNTSCYEWLNKNSNWQIKKFADKLKDVVCLLTGCNRDDLENEDFKNQEIGSDWVKYVVSYEDAYDRYTQTFTSKLGAEHHAEKMFMENYIVHKIQDVKLTYRMLLQLLGTEAGRNVIHPDIWVNSLMQDYIVEKDDILKIPLNHKPYSCSGLDRLKVWWSNQYNEKQSNVLVYHYLGSHGVHNNMMFTDYITVQDDFNKYNSEIKLVKEDGKDYVILTKKGSLPNWIITDLRFPNEYKAVKDRGGITIRVNRDNELQKCINDPVYFYENYICKSGNTPILKQYEKDFIKETLKVNNKHESETALDGAKFDYVIDNNGTIEELVEKVKIILSLIQVI